MRHVLLCVFLVYSLCFVLCFSSFSGKKGRCSLLLVASARAIHPIAPVRTRKQFGTLLCEGRMGKQRSRPDNGKILKKS